MQIRGLSKEKIAEISRFKKESKEVLDFRLKAYDAFLKLPMPDFGPKLSIDFDQVVYYEGNLNGIQNDWEKVDLNAQKDLAFLDVPGMACAMDGVGVQYQSEVIYHEMIQELVDKNVIFTSIEDAIFRYPELVFRYFSKIVGVQENKFTALNSAVFSGGSFIYIPKHTHLKRPLQSYFRISSKDLGQFERTLIIVDEDSSVSYMEGCTAKMDVGSNLHAAVVEIYVGKNSKCRYTTIQNWSNQVDNLVTKRAFVEEGGTMEWIDGNVGSRNNMKYPCCILKGDYSSGVCITIGVAGKGQHQDTGAKMIHLGKHTKSKIIAKSIASSGGRSDYRGKIEICDSADHSLALLECDTLLVDDLSKSDTYPTDQCFNDTSSIEHEATVSTISEEKLFYLKSRGLSLNDAKMLLILGFTDEFKKELPVEYAVELNQLLKTIL